MGPAFKLKKEAIVLQIVALAYMMPVNINLFNVGDKPVDFAISNLLVFLTFLSLFIIGSINKASLVAVGVMLFFPALGGWTSISMGGSFEPLLSSLSFFLPMLHILVGAVVAKSFSISPKKYFARALAIVVIVMFFSDIALGVFPRGCSPLGRWGGCLGPFEVYGFPNAPMNFLAVVAPILVFLLTFTSSKSDHILAFVALFALTIIMPLSLSRSAALIMGFSLLFFVYHYLGKLFLIGIAALFALLYLNIDTLLNSVLGEGVALRMMVAIENGDITTGRIGIWQKAFALFSESPIFGFGFQYFSNFSIFGTVHQQYLEILFKAGLVGFILYFGVFYVSLLKAFRQSRHIVPTIRDLNIRVIAMIILSVLISNLFQPAMSYQVFGNFLFFWCGYFLSYKGRQNEANPPKSLNRSIRTG